MGQGEFGRAAHVGLRPLVGKFPQRSIPKQSFIFETPRLTILSPWHNPKVRQPLWTMTPLDQLSIQGELLGHW